MKLQRPQMLQILWRLINLPKKNWEVKDGMVEWLKNKEQNTYSNNAKTDNENDLLVNQYIMLKHPWHLSHKVLRMSLLPDKTSLQYDMDLYYPQKLEFSWLLKCWNRPDHQWSCKAHISRTYFAGWSTCQNKAKGSRMVWPNDWRTESRVPTQTTRSPTTETSCCWLNKETCDM
jgi:hypothetical protein